MLAPIKGFAPDLSPTEPGVLTSCVARVPTLRGMKAAPSPLTGALPALSAAALHAEEVTKLDGTRRFFAGTTTALYESAVSSWTNRTRAAGAYSAAADIRWRFAQYGDITLATQKGDKIQQISSAAAFEDITAAPKAAVVEVVDDFVAAFNTSDAGFGDSPDRWWICAQGNYADWTPAQATNCYSGRLTSTPGDLRAGRRLGSKLVAYKESAMYLGQFAGPPIGWQWEEVSNFSGAQSQEVVVPIVTKSGGAAHIFMGKSDFYYYDGSRPLPIGNPLKDWFFGRLNKSFAYRSVALHDPANALILFLYPSTSSSSGALDSGVVYNYRADRWGVYDLNVETAAQKQSGGFTYGTLESTYATYSAIPSVSYGSPFWFAGQPVPAIFNASHVLQTLNGAAGESSYTTGDLGLDEQVSLVSRVRPREVTAPSSAVMTNYYRQNLGDALTTGATTTKSSGKFDVLRSARWHRFKVTDQGESEVMALDVIADADGFE